jgi:hypothetical protein
MIFGTLWAEEEREGRVWSLVLTVIPYRIPENMTGTDQDNTEIDSRLLVSFCCANSMIPYLYPANYGKCWRIVSPLSWVAVFILGNINGEKNLLGESLEESVAYWRGGPIGDTLSKSSD